MYIAQYTWYKDILNKYVIIIIMGELSLVEVHEWGVEEIEGFFKINIYSRSYQNIYLQQ